MPTLSETPLTAISTGRNFSNLLKEAPKSAEIKLVEMRSGLRLDPSDVGVGISQVLPIVVGAVLPGGSVVAIEQPELHIHPAMQVALGDLFIEGATKRGMSFLIETHSEHLILRLMRRIRELGWFLSSRFKAADDLSNSGLTKRETLSTNGLEASSKNLSEKNFQDDEHAGSFRHRR
jgi:predicted ATPase